MKGNRQATETPVEEFVFKNDRLTTPRKKVSEGWTDFVRGAEKEGYELLREIKTEDGAIHVRLFKKQVTDETPNGRDVLVFVETTASREAIFAENLYDAGRLFRNYAILCSPLMVEPEMIKTR